MEKKGVLWCDILSVTYLFPSKTSKTHPKVNHFSDVECPPVQTCSPYKPAASGCGVDFLGGTLLNSQFQQGHLLQRRFETSNKFGPQFPSNKCHFDLPHISCPPPKKWKVLGQQSDEPIASNLTNQIPTDADGLARKSQWG